MAITTSRDGPQGHAQIIRNYAYDMNGNQVSQRIGKSKAICDYMRSNLPKHVYGRRDTTATAYSDLYYDYNNHDDRIYKKVQNSIVYCTYDYQMGQKEFIIMMFQRLTFSLKEDKKGHAQLMKSHSN